MGLHVRTLIYLISSDTILRKKLRTSLTGFISELMTSDTKQSYAILQQTTHMHTLLVSQVKNLAAIK